MAILLNGELALTKSVPQLDGLIARSGDDLTVVSREGHREDILLVANETAGGKASVQVPKTEGLVPRGRQGELTIRRDNNVLDSVVVSVKRLARNTKVAVVIAGQVPDDDGLVCTRKRSLESRQFSFFCCDPLGAVRIHPWFWG